MESWGLSPWGSAKLQLLTAFPVRENVIRLGFNLPVYFSTLLDPGDGSSRHRYVVTPAPGSRDGDGDPTRPVSVAAVTLASFVGSAGAAVDATLDRPLSSFPARYSVSVNQVRSTGGALLDLTMTSAGFDGCQYDEVANRPVTTSGDFANPQTASGFVLGISPEQAAILGSFPIGPDGDYANDQGIDSWRKRVIRRVIARKRGFAHIPDFGVGPQARLKKLFTGTEATEIAADAQAQVLSDPETASATVTFMSTPGHPEIGYYTIIAKHVTGQTMNEMVALTGGA